jgi:hypothetical protein
MSSSNHRGAASPIRGLGCRVPVNVFHIAPPVFLLQFFIGFSRSLSGAAGRPEALARALILDGRERLRGLRSAAPHFSLPVDQLLKMVRSHEANDEDWSPEESVVKALLEMCVGLMLQWLSRRYRESCLSAARIKCETLFLKDPPSHSNRLARILSPKARSCPIS